MSESVSANKRIVKNTMMLYVRMILTMVVSLYTSRIVLDKLGVEDYGIYNVVGGVVGMLTFLNSTLSSTCQRYFSYEIGCGNKAKLAELFKQNVTLFVFYGLCVLILAETVGLWFINHHLVIPANRVDAMNWVYQFSLLTFVASSLSIPYNALIISHERMSAFAILSIIEVTLKLAIAFMLGVGGFDRLAFYSILLFLSTLIITIFYYIYCRRFPESRYSFSWNPNQAKEIISYSSWHLLGSLSVVVKEQGVNILLNAFFNPIVNGARAIAYQVSNAVNGLTRNFLIAVKPQIYKLYGSRELERMHLLVSRSSKMGFLLVSVCAYPVILNTDYLLFLWLGQLPEYTVLFTQIVLVNSIVQSVDVPAIASALATGKIKRFEILTGGLMIMNLPISYIFLKCGYAPEITMYVSVGVSYLIVIIRAFLLENMIRYKAIDYAKDVILPLTLVGILSVLPAWIVGRYMESSFWKLLTTTFVFVSSLSLISYFILFNHNERATVVDYSKRLLKKFTKR